MNTDAQRLRQEWEDRQAFSRAAKAKASQEAREGLRLKDAEINRTARAQASAGMRGDLPDHTQVAEITPQGNKQGMEVKPTEGGTNKAAALLEVQKQLNASMSGNQGQTDNAASALNTGASFGLSAAALGAGAGAGAAAAGAGVAIGLIQAAAARRQARNALENEKQLKLIDIEDKRSERIQNALQSMASNMGQTLRNNQQIRL